MSDRMAEGESSISSEVGQVLEKLVRTIVGDPEGVQVTASTDKAATVLRVRVSRADVGKVVGKDGRTARALRTILAAAGQANGQRFMLDIQERTDARTEG